MRQGGDCWQTAASQLSQVVACSCHFQRLQSMSAADPAWLAPGFRRQENLLGTLLNLSRKAFENQNFKWNDVIGQVAALPEDFSINLAICRLQSWLIACYCNPLSAELIL